MNDTIYRQAAIDAFCKECYDTDGEICDRDDVCGNVMILKALPSAQPEPITIQIDHEPTADEIESLKKKLSDAPIVLQPERKTGRWNKLMMYLADLQLTYSPNWGANGCGDEKLYEFVTGLIEELEGWEDGGGA